MIKSKDYKHTHVLSQLSKDCTTCVVLLDLKIDSFDLSMKNAAFFLLFYFMSNRIYFVISGLFSEQKQ